MAAAAYDKNPPKEVGGFKLLADTPTLKFYSASNTIIVAVRGTDDTRDVAAWHLVAFGQLDNSPRYQEDLQALREFQKNYPKTQYNYIGVGHSLGGAIIDRFLRMGLLNNALSYNAAPEPQELKGNPVHRRIYHEDDPLYKIAGRFIPGIEVRKSRDPFWVKYLRKLVPLGIANAYNAITKHKLPTFQGGGTHRENFLKANKLDDKSYSLKQLAIISKVPLATLQKVYNRGIGAYKTQPKSVRLKGSYVKNVNAPMSAKLSKERWAYARVYSFLDGNPKHDEDLRRRGGMGNCFTSAAVAPAPEGDGDGGGHGDGDDGDGGDDGNGRDVDLDAEELGSDTDEDPDGEGGVDITDENIDELTNADYKYLVEESWKKELKKMEGVLPEYLLMHLAPILELQSSNIIVDVTGADSTINIDKRYEEVLGRVLTLMGIFTEYADDIWELMGTNKRRVLRRLRRRGFFKK